MIDCNQLTGRMKEICQGTSGLSEEKRQAYLALWQKPSPHLIQSTETAPQVMWNLPGTCLKYILSKAGILNHEGCGCDDYAKLMDLWGVNTCEQKIEEIIAHLNSQNVSWFDMLRVAKAGYLTTRSLVQAAIDKARE